MLFFAAVFLACGGFLFGTAVAMLQSALEARRPPPLLDMDEFISESNFTVFRVEAQHVRSH